MIIWNGKGFLVPVIFIAILLISQLGIDATMGEGTYTTTTWAKLVPSIIAAIVIFFVGNKLNQAEEKVYIEKDTGKEIQAKPNHSFFFVPMQYWAAIILVIGVAMTVV